MSTERREHDSEREPLLRSSSPSVSKAESYRPTPILWILAPSIFAYALQATITTTTLLDIFRRLSCRIWYLVNDPDAIPRDGPLTDDMCRTGKRHSPEAYFTTALTILTLTTGLFHFIASSAVAKYANTWGRKRVYAVLTMIDAVAAVTFALTADAESVLELVVLLIGILLGLFGGVTMAILPATMMVVDTVDASARSSTLSRLQGFMFFGMAPGYVVGGYLTTTYGPMVSIRASAVLTVANVIWVLAMFPETLTIPEINEVHAEEAEEDELEHRKSFPLRALHNVGAVIAPLKHLVPVRDLDTGRRNPRLLLFAVGLFIYSLGVNYFGQSIILYASNTLRFDAKDTGWLLSIPQSLKVVYLLGFLPYVLKFGRRAYGASPVASVQDDGVLANEDDLEDRSVTTAIEVTASHFDVHLVIASWLYDAVVIVACAFARTKPEYLFFVATTSLGAGWAAGFDSAVVASVHRLDTSAVLSAMSMIKSISEVLSPIIMGNIMTASLGTLPNLVFFVIAGTFTIGSVILLFVKDSDKHQE